MKPATVLLDGSLTTDAHVPMDDRGVTLGDGLFETIGVRRGQPERLEAHLDRLRDGCWKLRLPDATSSMRAAPSMWQELLQANGLDGQDAVLRITVTAGSGSRGLMRPATVQPRWWASAAPWELGPHLDRHWRVAILASPPFPDDPLAGVKHLGRLPWVLARDAAITGQSMDEGLLVNDAGNVISATSANVFAVIDGQLATPSLRCGALPGITRAAMIRAMEAQGQPVHEAPLPVSLLERASEIFLTNSLVIVAPVRTCGDLALNAPGPVTQAVAAALIQAEA